VGVAESCFVQIVEQQSGAHGFQGYKQETVATSSAPSGLAHFWKPSTPVQPRRGLPGELGADRKGSRLLPQGSPVAQSLYLLCSVASETKWMPEIYLILSTAGECLKIQRDGVYTPKDVASMRHFFGEPEAEGSGYGTTYSLAVQFMRLPKG